MNELKSVVCERSSIISKKEGIFIFIIILLGLLKINKREKYNKIYIFNHLAGHHHQYCPDNKFLFIAWNLVWNNFQFKKFRILNTSVFEAGKVKWETTRKQKQKINKKFLFIVACKIQTQFSHLFISNQWNKINYNRVRETIESRMCNLIKMRDRSEENKQIQ